MENKEMTNIYENNVPEWSDYKAGDDWPSMNELMPMSSWPDDDRSVPAKNAVEKFIDM